MKKNLTLIYTLVLGMGVGPIPILQQAFAVDEITGAIIQLSTDHQMRPDQIHPAFSADSTRILIQSGHLTGGQSLDLMTVVIPRKLR